ncbi:hypothetical protein ABZP36_003486 [Zizania latifolia]
MGSAGNGKGEAKKTGPEDTVRSLPSSYHGNLRSACSDQQLKQTLDSLASSKPPVTMAAPAPPLQLPVSLLSSFLSFKKSTHGTHAMRR